VARTLHRHAQIVLGGVGDHGRHVGGRLRKDDHRGMLVDRQVPGEAGGVPVVVAGEHDVAVDAGAEGGRIERRCRSRKA